MASDFDYPNPPGIDSQKRNNRTLIIVVVILVVLCCCVIGAGFIYWMWEYGGDMLLEYLGILPPA